MLVTVGLVLLRSAFGPDPDPRNVLRDLLSGDFSFGESQPGTGLTLPSIFTERGTPDLFGGGGGGGGSKTVQ